MFYTVYKTTNTVNGKYYIGMHQTNDLNDSYLGSGKILKQAIKKYGAENFSKEILYVFDNEQEMRDKEKELVVISEDTYNLCDGGKGGFGYLNRSGLSSRKGSAHSLDSKKKMSENRRGIPVSEQTKLKLSKNNGMKNADAKKKISNALTGKSKSEEHKRKIAEAIKRKHEEKRAAMVFNG